MAAAYLAAAIKMAIPITLAGLGESISEKSGVLNIGIEGIMLGGAFGSFIIAYFTDNLFLGVLAGILSGIIVSLIHAVISIKCKADQTIVGLALNFLVLGLSSFMFLMVFGQTTDLPSIAVFKVIRIPILSKIPVIGEILFIQDAFVYFTIFMVIILSIIFYKTEWGINLHAVGENPRAADTAGLNVNKIRYISCLFNGALGGLAGTYMTLVQFGFFIENITAGRGYIALAAVTLGRRNPVGVFAASLVIGFAEALQYGLQTMGIPVPSQLFTMFPYVIAVLVLLFSIGKTKNPTALGTPYIRSER
ncbi:simple sugar transport system permease protein [Natronincola ferrireducens]|uniref:Simple sugar transport system permease protein n=2 Tax=Natronincola ferrireducens TaxID=393762 RepID=A0A1G8Z7G5_9FIRM|nr:simple sugar transport system permease protein [Natronincola ferrireducens]